MHLFGMDMYLYDRSHKHDYIRLNSAEKSIVQAINYHHDVHLAWNAICSEYHIQSSDNEAQGIFEKFLNKMIAVGAMAKGANTQQVYGQEGKTFPAFVSIELTNKCNFRCTHCYKEAESKNDTFLDTRLALTIIEQLSGKVCSLDFTGGEATLHPALYQIAKSSKVGRLCLLTNGSHLSTLPNEVLECFDFIQISIYGNSSSIYEKYSKSLQFESVCKGIDRTINHGIKCAVTIQLRPDVINDLRSYMNLLYRIGVRNIRFGISQKLGRNKSRPLSLWDITLEDFARFMNMIQDIKVEYPDVLFTIPDWNDVAVVNRCTQTPLKIICSAGTRSIVISERGGVRPCIYMPSKYFEKISWPEYFELINAGKVFNFNDFIPECEKDLAQEQSNIFSICKNGFAPQDTLL